MPVIAFIRFNDADTASGSDPSTSFAVGGASLLAIGLSAFAVPAADDDAKGTADVVAVAAC